MTDNTINTLMIVVPMILTGGYFALVARVREQESELVNKYGVIEYESHAHRRQVEARAGLIGLLGFLILLPSALSILLGFGFMAAGK